MKKVFSISIFENFMNIHQIEKKKMNLRHLGNLIKLLKVMNIDMIRHFYS